MEVFFVIYFFELSNVFFFFKKSKEIKKIAIEIKSMQ